MAIIRVKGINGVRDGAYRFEFGGFTHGEMHTIKQTAGLRPAEYLEAVQAMDTDFVVAMALVALQRHGIQVPVSLLWEAPLGSLQLDLTEEEEQMQREEGVLPPTNAPVEHADDGASRRRSGESSSDAGEHLSENAPSSTGSQPSVTGSASDLETLPA